MRVIETPISIEELEELKKRSKAKVELVLLGKTERNGITLNRTLIEGTPEEIERFMERLRLARAGG
ncbi:TIGR04140 family protein [Thermococcus sp.]|uniref:TIGR04140 family protein n=1 Tax=Thermococcus sp. TaxID=35749 RepID=UPI0025ED1229|nr:TIGR04140 family protein [Thermococcus sp.]